MVKLPLLPGPFVIAASAAAALVYVTVPVFRLIVLCAALLFVAAVIAVVLIRRAGGQFFGRLNPILLNPVVPRIGLALAAGSTAGFMSIAMAEQCSPGLPLNDIVSIQGKLLDDPRSFAGDFGRGQDEERGMAVVSLSSTEADSIRVSARGKVVVFFPGGTMPRLREFGRNAEVFIEGRFLPEPVTKGASMAGIAVSPRFAASSVHVIGAAPLVEQMRTLVRSAVIARLEPKAWGGLAAALLLGTRENLEGELAGSFRDAGLSHILALSGMHLAFLSGMLAFILRKPLGKKASIIAGLVFIVLYVFLVGPQPSLVRAAIMYGMGVLLIITGTAKQSLALLSGAFIIQILLDPASPHSLSFIFSYLALGGIVLISGAFLVLFRGRIPAFLAPGLGASTAAFLVTSPAVAAFFGVLRPAGIIAAIFAAPLSGFFMALSLLWLFLAELPLVGILLDRLLAAAHFVLQWSIYLFARFPGLTVMTAAVCVITPLLLVGVFMLADRQARYRNELIPFAW